MPWSWILNIFSDTIFPLSDFTILYTFPLKVVYQRSPVFGFCRMRTASESTVIKCSILIPGSKATGYLSGDLSGIFLIKETSCQRCSSDNTFSKDGISPNPLLIFQNKDPS